MSWTAPGRRRRRRGNSSRESLLVRYLCRRPDLRAGLLIWASMGRLETYELVPPQLSPVPFHKPPWKICHAAGCSAAEAKEFQRSPTNGEEEGRPSCEESIKRRTTGEVEVRMRRREAEVGARFPSFSRLCLGKHDEDRNCFPNRSRKYDLFLLSLPYKLIRDLQGFCSPGCRNMRIDLDEEKEKANESSQRTRRA
ncbi:hypothetical protein B296_00000588 [Ensete ventricosum]|uniref:Uncharacterized protein n=1 Tax=Ensete ventricosum TaxID=4639 RepID=A0A427BC15_ENSVE|nr:hypothetical protein B296_00000588 [Ensete ventricosum]